MTWPVSLQINDDITLAAPADMAPGSPIRGLEAQRVTAADGHPVLRVLYSTADGITHAAWPRGAELPPMDTPLGRGIGLVAPADFARDVFEVGRDGVLIDVDFTDREGRRLVWRVRQPRPWRGFGFVAPPAAGMRHPTSFFFPYMPTFGFVPQPLEFEASFGGAPFELQRLPFPWHWRRALAMKASVGMVVVELLKDGVPPLAAEEPGLVVDTEGRLLSCTRPSSVADVVLQFHPPLPRVEGLADTHTSRWRISVAGDRVAEGTVTVSPDEDGAVVAWLVTRGWGGGRGLRPGALLTRAVPMLRRWPTAYSWLGRVVLAGDGPRLVGRWRNARPVGTFEEESAAEEPSAS